MQMGNKIDTVTKVEASAAPRPHRFGARQHAQQFPTCLYDLPTLRSRSSKERFEYDCTLVKCIQIPRLLRSISSKADFMNRSGFGSAIERGKALEVHHFCDLGKRIILGEDSEPSICFIVVIVVPGVACIRISPPKPVTYQRP